MSDPTNAERWARVEAIFDRALDLQRADRETYLREACASDASLRREVESLLASADSAGPLDSGLVRLAADLAEEASAGLEAGAAVEGRRVGPWRIRHQIGTGGMGRVFLAERADGGFEQLSALKLLRWEMATENLIERFRTERQILADLDHPGIARLVDGGVTEDSLPYLAMEYVDGEPIDAYCRGRSLTIAQRLELFRSVSEVVHFAHRNLIVHRDLKPSNILVTDDGQVKLLDFGIAKIVDEAAGGGELTRTHLAPATPACAAPEQLTGGTITTATDIWALGALLYELLTGARPFGDSATGVTELTRQILEQDPRAPSERADASDRRRLRGDLDNIVLKALRKEPEQRYSSAERLAEDVRRHLEGEPISARPATFAYRARKFVRRNRAGLAITTAVALLLAGLVGFYTWRLADERDRARQSALQTEQVTNFVLSLFEVNDPTISRGEEISARELLNRGAERIPTELADQPEIRAEMHRVVGRLFDQIGVYEEARDHFAQAVDLHRELLGPAHPEVATDLSSLGFVLQETNEFEEAERVLREAMEIRRDHPEDQRGLSSSLNELGLLLAYKGDYDEAEALLRESLELKKLVLGEVHAETATTMNNLALTIKWKGDLDAAEPLYRRALEITIPTLGKEHPDYAGRLDNLGVLLGQRGDYEESEACFREALEIRRKLLGDAHPDVALNLNNLATLFRVQGRLDDAEPIYRDVLKLNIEIHGEDHPRVATNLANLASVLLSRDEVDEAVDLFERAVAIRRASFGDSHIETAMGLNTLSGAVARQGRYSDAEPLSREAVDVARRAVDEKSFQLAQILRNHGDILLHLDRHDDAEPYLREALTIQDETLSPGHWETAVSRSLLGMSLARAGEFEAAEPLLLEGHQALVAARGEDHPAVSRARDALAELYASWGRPEKARPFRSDR